MEIFLPLGIKNFVSQGTANFPINSHSQKDSCYSYEKIKNFDIKKKFFSYFNF